LNVWEGLLEKARKRHAKSFLKDPDMQGIQQKDILPPLILDENCTHRDNLLNYYSERLVHTIVKVHTFQEHDYEFQK